MVGDNPFRGARCRSTHRPAPLPPVPPTLAWQSPARCGAMTGAVLASAAARSEPRARPPGRPDPRSQ
jgi:hypothetical protein